LARSSRILVALLGQVVAMARERKRMTNDRINEIFQSVANDDPEVHMRFARAIEAECRQQNVAMLQDAPMAQSNREKQESYRARQTMLGLTEVRGIFLPPELHQKLKDEAKRMLESAKKR
jgi:hypothetical protein